MPSELEAVTAVSAARASPGREDIIIEATPGRLLADGGARAGGSRARSPGGGSTEDLARRLQYQLKAVAGGKPWLRYHE
eukprot:2533654-Alexandrium_andersonii.AAC.1